MIRIETPAASARLDPRTRSMLIRIPVEGVGPVRQCDAFYGLDGDIDPDDGDILTEPEWHALEAATAHAVEAAGVTLPTECPE